MKFLSVLLAAAALATPAPLLAQEEKKKRVAPPDMQAVAPALADYTDNVLFGDLWLRKDLSPRDRSLVTITALIAGGHVEQMASHMRRALDNGLKPAEISAAITHLAFYAGWPRAVSAVRIAKEVFAERGITPGEATKAASPTISITRASEAPATAGAPTNFTGAVKVAGLFKGTEPARVGGGTVSFEPGARTAWHTHPLGQTLIVTAGEGRVQMWDGPVQVIKPGDVVFIPPGVKHWHGAGPQSAMTHVAIAEALNGKSVDWLEHVSDEHYRAAR